MSEPKVKKLQKGEPHFILNIDGEEIEMPTWKRKVVDFDGQEKWDYEACLDPLQNPFVVKELKDLKKKIKEVNGD